MRTAILTALWKRPDCTRRCLHHHYDMHLHAEAMGLGEIGLFAVGSEGEVSRSLAERNGYTYVEYPNDHLWKKWNAVAELAGEGWDAYLVLGADDIVTPAYFGVIEVLLKAGMHFIQPDKAAIYCGTTQRTSFHTQYDGGAGRVFSGALFHRLQGKLWQQNSMASIDHYQRLHVNHNTTITERCKLPVTLETPWQVVDIKGKGMWPWADFDPSRNYMCTEIQTQPYIEHYFPTFEWHRIKD